MRRNEREVNNHNEIIDILKRCNTIRLGLSTEDGVYIVPVSFGIETDKETIVLYFHSSKLGRKADALTKNPVVAIEGDIFYAIEKTAHGITTRYECIMANGICERLETVAEKQQGLNCITARYGYADYPLDRCKGFAAVDVYRIKLTNITAKRNLSE